MTIVEFWKIIDKIAAKNRRDMDRFETALNKKLKSLAAGEIVAFAKNYADVQNEANTPGILEAALIIGCGDSDDGFTDFRRWIIFQGKQNFDKIINNPDFLGGYDRKSDPIENWFSEYSPLGVYWEVTGEDIPDFEVTVFPEVDADSHHPELLADRFPKLWKRVHSKHAEQKRLGDMGQDMFLNATLDAIEAHGGDASFIFSTGAEIYIRGYWEHFRRRYNVSNEVPDYDDHPMLKQTVVSIQTASFPHSFFMWFGNRRKLSFSNGVNDCTDFDVFMNIPDDS